MDGAFKMYLLAERGLSDRTALVYGQRLKHIEDHLAGQGKALATATADELQGYLRDQLKAGRDVLTVSHAYYTLRTWLKYQAACGRDTRAMIDYLQGPKVRRELPHPPNEDQIRRIKAAIIANRPNRIQQLRDTALFLVLYQGGLRADEVTNLKVSHITIEPDGAGMARVSGKGSRDRVVRLGPEAIGALSAYWFTVQPQPDEPALMTMRRRRIKGPHMRRIVLRWGKWANLPRPITTHTFRHAFATHWLGKMTEQGMGGEAILHVQRQLGHSKLTTTEVYTHVEPKSLKRWHAQFAPARMR